MRMRYVTLCQVRGQEYCFREKEVTSMIFIMYFERITAIKIVMVTYKAKLLKEDL